MAVPAALLNFDLTGVNTEVIKILQHILKTIDHLVIQNNNKTTEIEKLTKQYIHLTARVHCLEKGQASMTTQTTFYSSEIPRVN